MFRLCVLLLFLAICSNICLGEIAHKRFEYKYSFKGPYLAQKDGTVPFWEYGGNAIASEEMVRITPSLRSKKGNIWTKSPITFPWWEVEIVFRVNGRGRLGADGLAFWYTSMRYPEGPVFGSSDRWNGLGIFFDSFDNDNRNNNPYIMAMLNDGSKPYDHDTDGINQQLAGCLRDFRNKPYPVRAKVEYFMNVLTVMFHSGNTNSDDDYEMCLRAENVFLPQNGYFGVSAATGGLADDHDVLKFMTWSLYAPGQAPVSQGTVADPEKEKFSREYEQYKEKLEKQKEEYKKAHPDQVAEHDPEMQYESNQAQELRQIFEGQSHLYDGLKAVHRKLDEILGRQERTLSLVSNAGAGMAVAQPGGAQAGHPPVQYNMEAVLSSQREILQTVNTLRSALTDLNAKVASAGGAPIAGGGNVGGGVPQQWMNEMRDALHEVKREVSSPQMRDNIGCPKVSCVSTVMLAVFSSIQIFTILGYLMYRNSKQDAAKKFY